MLLQIEHRQNVVLTPLVALGRRRLVHEARAAKGMSGAQLPSAAKSRRLRGIEELQWSLRAEGWAFPL